ncbi:PREDICTED: helicase sen1 [Ceratosolen solmsi marchali]|uniref:Helicase sen1 n=1 Tax=Ceratosolen solmsi marchali TaxID=326594 RepID=A0AAJ6YBG3_9HYME|nr:PREDICTED: helicase sen1 [Ceratosolen solmsi marchali]
MEVERILERVGSKKEVVIDKNFFYCGRMKENDLICLSLLVSREHCLFTKLLDGLYVTDLGSSNGVYINGVQIRPKKQILLKEKDYIGIGCAEMINLNESMFVYKVKSRKVSDKNLKNIDSVDLKESNLEECSRLVLKEQSRSRKSDSVEILTKVPKATIEHKLIISNYNHNLYNNTDENDINIVESSNMKNSLGQMDEHPLVQKKNVNTMNLYKKDDISKEASECLNALDYINTNVEKLHFDRVPQVLLSKGIDVKEIQRSNAYKNNNENMELDLVPKVYSLTHKASEKHLNDNIILENIFFDNVNIKQESHSYINPNNSVSIKQEPDLDCFSQIDLVEINDDEDSIFPFSQLFDKSVVKEELEEQDKFLQQSSLFLDDDDENVITILDSDDENACDINKLTDLGLKIKNEPEFEFPDMTVPTSFASNNVMNISPDNIDALSDNILKSNIKLNDNIANNKMTNALLKEQEESTPHQKVLPEILICKNAKIPNKTKNKGLEIIEPHFMKPKLKVVKKDKNKSKNKEKSESKHDKIKKHSSDSSSSFIEKSVNKELSKDKIYEKDTIHSSTNSSAKISRSNKDKKHIITKCKSTLAANSKKYKYPNKRKKHNESFNKSDSSSVENVSMYSEPQKEIRSERKTTIVKVKISTKTRGDMLYDSMQSLKPRIKSKKLSSTKRETSNSSNKASKLSSFVIPRRQVPPSSISTSDSVLGVNESSNPQSKSCNKQTISILSNTTNLINVSSTVSNLNNNRSPSKEQITEDKNMHSKLQSLKSLLTIPSLHNRTQKKVSFKENISSIREFGIEEGNRLRNIKEGLSIRSTKKDFLEYKIMELKIEDFLARVFDWEPIWLEQQQTVKALPPIVKKEDMHELPNHYKSFEEYYKKMEVLLLLETWQQLLKEYECTGNRYNSSIVLPCKLVRHSVRQMQTPNGFGYSTLLINTIVSKNQLRLQNHPVYGDMIILEYVIKEGVVQKMRRIFAYVVQVQQQNSLKFLKSNEQLCKYVTNPDALLSYTVQTRKIDEHTVQFDQIARLRSIMYMRSHLRLIQSLQYLPHSLLRDSILKVDIKEFQLEPVTKQQIYDYQLVTKEKLNEKQVEAVIKFTNASIKLESKIGLLNGPPGTGKSKVIANLVTQILYGDGRYVGGRPFRILVCAPSNAAVDEVVLRLLEIRGAIKEHRFKMVRIGRIESMHEEVKKISVTELAKREAQKIYFNQRPKGSENVENKKYKLKTDINALELLLAKNPDNQMYKKDLKDYRAKYKNLTNISPVKAAELSKLQNSAKILILQKANVIACTLSSCYTSQMESIFRGYSNKITICIVDEATQCCEAETLIPLMLGVKNLILVGDPNQLSATIMSTEAKKLGLDKSLFTRIKMNLESQYQDVTENCNDPIIMLNVQYRMVNDISYWPNHYFYGGKLMNAVNNKQNFPFQPYRVLNLDAVQDDIKFYNTSEAVFVGNLINCLMTYAKLSSWDKKITIGVITPYQNQKSLILSTIKEYTRNISANIKNKFITEVNTIDSFQGQERDIIIMSCVRSSGIGFLSDQQRLCVALTRAKYTLIICGNFTTFQRDNAWNNLLQDACSREVVAYLNTNAKPHDIKYHVIKLD